MSDALFSLAVICQIILALDSCVAAFFIVLLSGGALGTPHVGPVAESAAKIAIPFLLALAAPIILIRSRGANVFYLLLILDLFASGLGAFMAHDFGLLAALVYVPAVVMVVLLLLPPIRGRFHEKAGGVQA